MSTPYFEGLVAELAELEKLDKDPHRTLNQSQEDRISTVRSAAAICEAIYALSYAVEGTG